MQSYLFTLVAPPTACNGATTAPDRVMCSQALGIAIIVFSSVVKVPQILAVARAKSAEGLAPVSFELEQLGLCIHAAYGYLLGLPFNTYGEAAIILLQNTFLLYQVYTYSKAPAWRSTSVALAVVSAAVAVFRGASPCPCSKAWHACAWLCCLHGCSAGGGFASAGQVAREVITRAYDLNNVIFTAARLPQIYQNFKVPRA